MSNQIIVLRKALQQSKPFNYLRRIVENLLHDGYDKEDILAEFESFRKLSKDDSYEDVVLDVMDSLTGWCSPQMRIVLSKELENNIKVQPIIPNHGHQQRTTFYDLHRVMKRAWELARQTEVQRGWGHAYEYIIGGCLKMAWQEEKIMNAT